MSDFWENLLHGHSEGFVTSAIDHTLSGKKFGEDFESTRILSDSGRAKAALDLPVAPGTKVKFAGTLGSLFSYKNPPDKNAIGEVVQVRSATGNITSHDGKVFVRFEDGDLRTIHAEHLRLAQEKKAYFQLTNEEVDRCRVAKAHNGREYRFSIVARKQDDGKFLVAAVDVETGEPFGFDPQIVEPNKQAVFTAAARLSSWFKSLGWTEENKKEASSKKSGTMRFGDKLPIRFRVASLGEIADMFSPPGLGNLAPMLRQASGELIHKSTQDLWSFSRGGDGSYTVSRLFNDTGEPLKGV